MEAALSQARSALAECEAVVGSLNAMCCDPDRIQRIEDVETTLKAISGELDAANFEALERALERLEDAGAKIGSLQVGCCTQTRMPLYAEALAHLNAIQLDVAGALGPRL